MTREEFKKQYREARAISTASAMFSNSCRSGVVENPVYKAQWFFIDSLHPSVIYAVQNKYRRVAYRLKTNKWAFSHNSKF